MNVRQRRRTAAHSFFRSRLADAAIFFGLICGRLVVSLECARAVDLSEQQGREALRVIRESGRIVPTMELAFSSIERKSLKHLTRAINVLAVVSQFSFVVGAIWGLVRISGMH
jgi:hypothetical protein